MPLYEYVCRKCHKTFSEVLTIKEHETKKGFLLACYGRLLVVSVS
jgi:predicted nucleic acid-binding Zn ribbon protein